MFVLYRELACAITLSSYWICSQFKWRSF